jgi:L-alanine-DL-glutamate epimerase-like enolase superfamily enzyme
VNKLLQTNIHVKDVSLYFLSQELRIPLKFGAETVTYGACARVCVSVVNKSGRTAHGWGETPLSVAWGWPSSIAFRKREDVMKSFCKTLTKAWANFGETGHAMDLGHSFNENILPSLLKEFNASANPSVEPMPLLAALICCSAFDIAIHDAYGKVNDTATYETYNASFMNHDLPYYFTSDENAKSFFKDKYPADFLKFPRADSMPAWHLVGGKDLLERSELTGSEPDDGYPVLLSDWIEQDGLKCLKIKLRGNDADWDYRRLVQVGTIAMEHDALWLSADFNCLVTDPVYVNTILDRLMYKHPRIYQMILYVEQPFPYDLEVNRIDVRSVSARKPLFMDESAHDWKFVRMGRELGWTGVALKTCKTQTGALLSLCWAKVHGMTLMVQDLTNPMLAQIPHCLLAAYAGTIMGVETNAMQFCPAVSAHEEAIHQGLYRRRDGKVDLSSVRGAGFGYRIDEIKRNLPECVCRVDR